MTEGPTGDPNPFTPPRAELDAARGPDTLQAIGHLVPWVMVTGCAQVWFTALMCLTLLSGLGAGSDNLHTSMDDAYALWFPRTFASMANAVVLYLWVYRAVRAAQALRTAPQPRGPGLTVVGFFVPYANLLWPHQSMKALMQASDPEGPIDAPATDQGWRLRLGLWWAANAMGTFTTKMIAGFLLTALVTSDVTLSFMCVVSLEYAMSLLEVPLCMGLVRIITPRLLERARRLGVPLR
ncbi:MAG: DUF4328 domain-containing protein [Deltaproteobacteria bacterium]|nr:DUF4328 domain-containing protein [Deltaproteobacteria bacterium]